MFNYSQIDSSVERWMLEEILQSVTTHIKDYETSTPRVHCKDGFYMSCQANSMTYCTPRESGVLDYKDVEVGYPSNIESLLGNNDDEVYGYVSMSVIKKIVEKHGGLDHKKTFKDFPKIVEYYEEKKRSLKEKSVLEKDVTFLKPQKLGKKKI